MDTELKKSKKTILDQNGQYSVWMNPRQSKRNEREGGNSKQKQQRQQRV